MSTLDYRARGDEEAHCKRLLLFLWRTDAVTPKRRYTFELESCVRGSDTPGSAQAGTIFEGMLGFLRVAQRPRLVVEEQEEGLCTGRCSWVDGSYDGDRQIVMVRVPKVLYPSDRLSLAGTLAHKVANHYLEKVLCTNIIDVTGDWITAHPELRRQQNERFTDVAAVWLGFGPILVQARRFVMDAHAAVGHRSCVAMCLLQPLLHWSGCVRSCCDRLCLSASGWVTRENPRCRRIP